MGHCCEPEHHEPVHHPPPHHDNHHNSHHANVEAPEINIENVEEIFTSIEN